jgi:hypothetical protein
MAQLKRLKRQMFGRASLVLLERRFVLASGRGQAPSEAQVRPAAEPHAARAGRVWYSMAEGIEGERMRTYMVVALLSVIWLILIAMGHRRDVALTFAGIIVLICVARAWLEVRRGRPWIRG